MAGQISLNLPNKRSSEAQANMRRMHVSRPKKRQKAGRSEDVFSDVLVKHAFRNWGEQA